MEGPSEWIGHKTDHRCKYEENRKQRQGEQIKKFKYKKLVG
jgi:hypothetical protein